ncbi:uncharacterized protein LOC107423356 [Ziziphus jujuba]|uniref:Uncharacterized protein LOC107423356 n=2 Tax=Ziziphus jujuba TaxID=326968 RepID=A0A6P4AQ92_ZIZJJ|nr:uncharacterized protein LOC107423356 [Ziziphus jujuba]KAH7522427.1 hypothetical protein FEM48_Zijuj07G0137300 [Ziziphus jujuba var. spinosa]
MVIILSRSNMGQKITKMDQDRTGEKAEEKDQSPPPSQMDQDRTGEKVVEQNQSQLPTLHRTDADDEDENVKQLDECSSIYLSLQDCLVNKDRNWKACQKEVQALRLCNERRNKDKAK